jgi:8-oxo-dGTP pyrophosphatase MutT (NUDIX family)
MSSALNEFAKKLKYRLSLPLPGVEAQLKMAHLERRLNYSQRNVPPHARMGAVLILLYESGDSIMTCFIERTTYDGVHSGQIAFPGGKKETDETLVEAALREAEEEIGVKKTDVTVLGQLTELYIPPSNFLVHPFVGAITYTPDFFPEPAEVAEVVEVKVDDLFDVRYRGEKKIMLSNGNTIQTPYFNLQGKTVWGATAMIISEFLEVVTGMTD